MKVLVVTATQRDCFSGGKHPFWNADYLLQRLVAAIGTAQDAGVAVLLVQLAESPDARPFTPVEGGAEMHPRVLNAAPDAVVVGIDDEDAFESRLFEPSLSRTGATELLLCGPSRVVLSTALSEHPSALRYNITVLEDLCSHTTRILDQMFRRAMAQRVSDRVKLAKFGDIF